MMEPLLNIVNLVKNGLVQLKASNTSESGIYIVLQMYLVHVKILKMSKMNKETKHRAIYCNPKYTFVSDNWNSDTEDASDEVDCDSEESDSDSESESESD